MRLIQGLIAALLLMLLTSCDNGARYTEIIMVTPQMDPTVIAAPPHTSRERNDAALASFQSFGNLQTMSFVGDFDQIIEFQHHQLMGQFIGDGSGSGPSRGCSTFAHRTGRDGGLVGRNYDNRDTQVMVGWFHPTAGYASVALVPLADLGYTPEEPFDPASEQHRKTLLYAPVMSIEGMNEKGVTVALASLARRHVTQNPVLESRFLIHLVREILDHAGSVHEAVSIAEQYNVFDNGRDVISHHIFLADPHSGSAVLEWRDGMMHLVKDTGNWQVVTNSDLFEVAVDDRRQSCDRYDSLCKSMTQQAETMTWQEAMEALVKTKQKNKMYTIDGGRLKVSTQWSVVFDMREKAIYLVLGGNDQEVYRAAVEISGNDAASL